MGFYFRKSLSLGPVRLNFSKSGIGYSVGTRGIRIGSGPRRAYVHMGAHGLYYRASLRGGSSTRRPYRTADHEYPSPHQTDWNQNADLMPIESADVAQMRDATSDQILDELNAANRGVRSKWIVGLLALVGLAFAYGATTAAWLRIASVVSAALAVLVAVWWDARPRLLLTYDFDAKAEARWAELDEAFKAFSNVSLIRNIEARGGNVDWKRNAGAEALVRATDIRYSVGVPPRVACSLSVPILPAGREALYFFPDRLLVFSAGRFGAVSYADLHASAETTRFIEHSVRPRDATPVDTTWRFVNKGGGPDRRFRDNRQLPIYLYGALSLESGTGLRELFHTSRADACFRVAEVLQRYAASAPKQDKSSAAVHPVRNDHQSRQAKALSSSRRSEPVPSVLSDGRHPRAPTAPPSLGVPPTAPDGGSGAASPSMIDTQSTVVPITDFTVATAARLVTSRAVATPVLLQTELRVSMARANELLARLEEAGVVGPGQKGVARRVLLSGDDVARRIRAT